MSDKMRMSGRFMARRIANPTLAVALSLSLLTSGCTTVSGLFGGDKVTEGTPGFITGFFGAVVSDEPQATLAGRQVLSAGGNAADAAAAIALTLTVTLPSKASLGAGGACLVQNGDKGARGVPDAVVFLSPAPASSAGADRPAAAPMLARGLFLLNARYGRTRFETLLGGAEQMAREGTPASRALLRDLAVVAGPLSADPGARAVFFPGGQQIAEGARLVQPELAALYGQLRRAGVGDLYLGTIAQQLVAGSPQVGAGLTAADLRAALPRVTPALLLDGPNDATVAFLPDSVDGGLAAAAAYRVLAKNPSDIAGAKSSALAAAAAARGTASLPQLPASTSFAVLDREGNAVTCAITMGNLFGTGRMAPGTGMMLAASPAWLPPPLLSAGMVTNRRSSAVRVVAGGSGQENAPLAVAQALASSLADTGRVARIDPTATPDPGRANIIACNGTVTSPESCGWATDPRGFGYATGSN